MALTAQERSTRARIAAYTRSALYDARDLTQAARDGFLAKFEREADPEGKLDPAERERRALALRRAHMSRLALKSAQARRRTAS